MKRTSVDLGLEDNGGRHMQGSLESESGLPKIYNLGRDGADGRRSLCDNYEKDKYKAPKVDYLMYRDYHQTRRRSNCNKNDDEQEKGNQFYQPYMIRVSARCRMRIYSSICLPVEGKCMDKERKHKENLKELLKFNCVPRVLPTINTRPREPVSELRPALNYGEMLWKLNELAPINK